MVNIFLDMWYIEVFVKMMTYTSEWFCSCFFLFHVLPWTFENAFRIITNKFRIFSKTVIASPANVDNYRTLRLQSMSYFNNGTSLLPKVSFPSLILPLPFAMTTKPEDRNWSVYFHISAASFHSLEYFLVCHCFANIIETDWNENVKMLRM